MNAPTYTETRFSLTGITLAAKIWGPEDGTPVLALHGWLDNANTFDRLAPLLKGIRLVAVDLAGHGLSEHRAPGSTYYLWDHLANIAELVRQLKWRRFSLLGHSMGAGLSTWYAGTFPHQVERLALIDGFGAAFSVESLQLPQYLGKAIRRRQMALNVPINRFAARDAIQFHTLDAAIADRRQAKFGTLTREAASILLERGLEAVPGGFKRRNDPQLALPVLMEPDESAICAMIQQITAPTMLFLGDQGLFAHNEKAERLKHFKQLAVSTLPGGHHLHLESAAPDIAQQLHFFFESSLEPLIQTT